MCGMPHLVEENNMQIEVTKNDIKRGGIESCDCPVALAMRRHWPEARVGSTRFSKDMIPFEQHDLPDKAVNWIKEYDSGMPVAPFTFEVSV